MTVPPVLERTFHLHSHEVDQRGRAKPDVLFCFLMDSAWAHANKSEFSYDALKAEGQLWVLSRFLALFHKFPMWDEDVHVETWGKGTDKLFGLRDFVIWSDKKEKLVSATSAWLVIDRKTSRIQRIDLLNSNFPHQVDKNEIETRLDKIEKLDAHKTDFEQAVRFGDIDVNRHVNSSKYMTWILDSFPRDILETKILKSFEINFLSEAQLGEKMIVSSVESNGKYYCGIGREGDGAEVCRAMVDWKE